MMKTIEVQGVLREWLISQNLFAFVDAGKVEVDGEEFNALYVESFRSHPQYDEEHRIAWATYSILTRNRVNKTEAETLSAAPGGLDSISRLARTGEAQTKEVRAMTQALTKLDEVISTSAKKVVSQVGGTIAGEAADTRQQLLDAIHPIHGKLDEVCGASGAVVDAVKEVREEVSVLHTKRVQSHEEVVNTLTTLADELRIQTKKGFDGICGSLKVVDERLEQEGILLGAAVQSLQEGKVWKILKFAWGAAILFLLLFLATKAHAQTPHDPLIVRVQNGGTTLATKPAGLVQFNCSTNMTCSWANNTFTLTSSGGASGYATIQEEGSPLTQRSTLNFVGSSITCADTGVKTECTLTGGGGTPGGSDTQIQYNDATAFNGIPSFTYIKATPEVKLQAGTKFSFTDTTDTTKKVQFDLSGITTATTRTGTVPNAAFTFVVPFTCTNQVATAASSSGSFTCSTLTLASAMFQNQGTTTTVLHGNAAGNPSWGAIVSADLNITGTTCTNQVVTAISSSAAGTCTTITNTYTSGTFPATAHNLLSATHGDTAAGTVVLGDIIAGNSTPAWARVAGNTTSTKNFLTQTGNGSISALPAWGTIADADIPSTLTRDTEVNVQGTANEITSSGSGVAPTLSLASQLNLSGKEIIGGATPLKFEGATDNNIYWKLSITDPTVADKTTTVPNADTVLPQSFTCTNQVATALSGSTGAFTCTTITSAYTSGTFSPTAHNLLSASHGDTTTASAVRGDMIASVGAGATWQRVAHSTTTGGYWKWNGTDVVASTNAASGTGSPTTCTNQVVTAFTLNADAAPTSTCTTVTSAFTSGTFSPSAHNLLSSSHGDTATHTVLRGDIIAGIGASPSWTAVAKGSTDTYPKWNSSGDVVASTNAASGTGSPTACTNQFVTGFTLNADAAPTSSCTTATLASAQFANQGTTVTVLHGNAAGNPSFAVIAPADAVGNVHGNSTKFQLSDNTGSTGNCAKFDVNGNLTDNGSACGSITGTINSGTTGQVAYYPSNGTTLSGSALTYSATSLTTTLEHMTLGAGEDTTTGLGIYPAAGLTGTDQVGIALSPTYTSAATSTGSDISIFAATADAAFTMTDHYILNLVDITKGTGASVTNAHGLYIGAITSGGTSNHAIETLGGLVGLQQNNIQTTATDLLRVENADTTTSGVTAQYSPALRFTGGAWNTGGTPADNRVDFRNYVIPTSGNPPTFKLTWQKSINGGAFSEVASLTDGGTFNATTLTEGGTGVPNTGDKLSVFASTTSSEFFGVISDETGGAGAVVGASSPTITTPSFTTGFKIGGAAASGQILRGDGTNFVAANDVITVTYIAGGNNASSALADADDQPAIWVNDKGRTYRVTRVWSSADSSTGTPAVNLQRDDGSAANLLSSSLNPATGNGACADSSGSSMTIRGGSITCSNTISATERDFAVGDQLDFVMVTAGGTAKRITVQVQLTAQ